MKFYLDEDLSPEIAKIARAHGLDVASAHELGRRGWPDALQLQYAAAEGRCLVTKNRNDFLALTLEFFSASSPHQGVLIVPRSMGSDHFHLIAAALVRYAERHPTGLPPYSIDYLSVADVDC